MVEFIGVGTVGSWRGMRDCNWPASGGGVEGVDGVGRRSPRMMVLLMEGLCALIVSDL